MSRAKRLLGNSHPAADWVDAELAKRDAEIERLKAEVGRRARIRDIIAAQRAGVAYYDAEHIERLEAQIAFREEHYASIEKRYGEIQDERERLKTDLGERRMCVNCGKTRPASEGKSSSLPECIGPDGLSACTWDSTPQEAWEYWRDKYYELKKSENSLG